MNLYAHQQAIIDADPKRTGLFLGTGSGKTRTALMLARGKTLVICPKTQKEDGNWEREYMELVSYGKIQLTELQTISKETFRRDYKTIGSFDTVIVDEAHTMLGVTPTVRSRKRVPEPKASQLFDALDDFLRVTKPERLYLCTATIIRSPMTVWAAYKLLNPAAPGSTFRGFLAFREKYYMKLPMPGRDVWQARSDSYTKDALADMVRRMGNVGRLEDFFDVPAQSYKTDVLELTDIQKGRLKDISIEYPDPLVQTGKRHQVENGVLAGDMFNAPEEYANAKLEKIRDYALEFPRMVVFAKYRAQIGALERALSKEGYTVLTMTGDTTDRGDVIARANVLDAYILIVSAQISAGWELPACTVMIFASRSYSYVDWEQSLGRIQRANNIKKNLYITLVTRGGVDEAVDKALKNKSDFSERIYAEAGK